MDTDTLKLKLVNLTKGIKYITSIIINKNVNIPFRDEEIELLLKQHPNEKKITDIEYLVVRIRPPFNGKALYIKI